MDGSHHPETRSSKELRVEQDIANKDGEYFQRGQKLAAAFQDATGIEAKSFLPSTRFVDPKNPLIKVELNPKNDSSKNMDNIIDHALIPFRESAGLTRDDIGFAMSEKGNGHLSKGKIIVHIKWDMNDPAYDDKIIELLKNNADALKKNIRKAEGLSTSSKSELGSEKFQVASEKNLGGLPQPVTVALGKLNNGIEKS